jgi:hypothetical protein
VIDVKGWVLQAERIQEDDGYTYESLALDLVDQLGWTRAIDVATGLRAHVYGWPGRSELHTAVRPIYQALGWEQSALVCAWFRDSRNWPQARSGCRPVAAPKNKITESP